MNNSLYYRLQLVAPADKFVLKCVNFNKPSSFRTLEGDKGDTGASTGLISITSSSLESIIRTFAYAVRKYSGNKGGILIIFNYCNHGGIIK